MLINERQSHILEILADRQAVSVAELSALLNVSGVTIRTDLNQLAEQGRLVRTHGGAMLLGEKTRQELTFATRQQLQGDQKARIGELAASLVQPRNSILLDASTTALAVGQALKTCQDLGDLSVVTTGVWTALELLGIAHLNVILVGGNLRTITGSTTGSIARDVLNKINIHRAFLGAWGITVDHGLTEASLQEVELKQHIIERSQEVIAVVDSTKFGRVGLSTYAPVEKIDRIVTDEGAPADVVAEFRKRGVEVCIAERVG
ncbi:MAG: DeoR/GlpR transcriptional regulator [Anaerolineae bacterium]|nr:DeoR/GlpR transcriptional regulator [Anaerolineae bacterium]